MVETTRNFSQIYLNVKSLAAKLIATFGLTCLFCAFLFCCLHDSSAMLCHVLDFIDRTCMYGDSERTGIMVIVIFVIQLSNN